MSAVLGLCDRQFSEDVGCTHEDDGGGGPGGDNPRGKYRCGPDTLVTLRQNIRGRRWLPATVLAIGAAAGGRLGPVVRQRSNSSHRANRNIDPRARGYRSGRAEIRIKSLLTDLDGS